MMGGPLVSVVVPLYNVPEKYFSACMESLCGQTLADIEIVVVDDGSTSGVENLADGFAARDGRVRVFHRENGGVSAARNFGIRSARGKYLSFLDADDWLDRDILQKAYTFAGREALDIVYWGTVREYAGKSVRCITPSYLRVGTVYEGKECEQLRLAVMDLAAPLSSPFGKIVRRDLLIGNALFFDEELKNYAEDFEWSFRLSCAARRVAVLDEYAHHYVCNPASLTSCISAENAASSAVCIRKLRSEAAGLPDAERLLKAVEYRALFLLTAVAISGFFHPRNRQKYREKKRGFQAFTAQEEVRSTLRSPVAKKLSFARRTVVFLMRRRLCLALRILGYLRYKSKKPI